MVKSSIIRWVLAERGRYKAARPGGGVVELERRRQEGSDASGWYLYGELATGTVIVGEWMGEFLPDAVVEATERGAGPTASGRRQRAGRGDPDADCKEGAPCDP